MYEQEDEELVLKETTLSIISVLYDVHREMNKTGEYMTRNKPPTIAANLFPELKDTMNRSAGVKEKSQLHCPSVKVLLVTESILKSYDFLELSSQFESCRN